MKDYFEYNNKRYYYDKITSIDDDINVEIKYPFNRHECTWVNVIFSYNIYLGGDKCTLREKWHIWKYHKDPNNVFNFKKETIKLFGFIPIKVKIPNRLYNIVGSYFSLDFRYYRLKHKYNNCNLSYAEYVARKLRITPAYQKILEDKNEILKEFQRFRLS